MPSKKNQKRRRGGEAGRRQRSAATQAESSQASSTLPSSQAQPSFVSTKSAPQVLIGCGFKEVENSKGQMTIEPAPTLLPGYPMSEVNARNLQDFTIALMQLQNRKLWFPGSAVARHLSQLYFAGDENREQAVSRVEDLQWTLVEDIMSAHPEWSDLSPQRLNEKPASKCLSNTASPYDKEEEDIDNNDLIKSTRQELTDQAMDSLFE